MAHVLFSSGEEGDVGSDRPPGDPYPPQHDCSQHPDQRRLRADQPADPRDQAAPRGCQTAEVSLPLRDVSDLALLEALFTSFHRLKILLQSI